MLRLIGGKIVYTVVKVQKCTPYQRNIEIKSKTFNQTVLILFPNVQYTKHMIV